MVSTATCQMPLMLHARTQARSRVATDISARVATDAFVRPAKAKPSGIFPTAEITAESQSPLQLQRAILLQNHHSICMQRLRRRLRHQHPAEHPSSKHPNSHARIIATAKCYAEAMSTELICRHPNRLMWRQPPRLSREGKAERPRARTLPFCRGLTLLVLSLPLHAAIPWTI